ncbi:MAG TPA: penicillin-binding protein 2, partial [Polyangiaceae bacterium]|nr:penicillin-binding protein 2 [Polyangiaceae bacterium]
MSILVQRSDVGEFRRRYRWMVLICLAAFLSLLGRLVILQVIQGDVHRGQARRNIVREIKLATRRGVIRDAEGRVLAANRPSYNVYAVPSQLNLEQTWPRVQQMLGVEAGEAAAMKKRITEAAADERRKDQQILLSVDVDRDVVAVLETHETELKGIEVVPVPVRNYPYGEIAAHLIGYMREVDAEDLAELESRGYRPGDRLGAVGIERRWESYLRGKRGTRKTIVAMRRMVHREELEAKYLDEPRLISPVPGRDISLTIDVELQQSIERAMRGQLAGAVVVVDVRTGRLLAATSKPSYDPSVLSGGRGLDATREAFRRLYSDPLKPMLDKTISAAYPPGSTFKPFTALAALEEGVIDSQTEVDCRGGYEYGKRFFRCTGVHRRVRLHDAIVQSCNSYFYAIGAHERMQIDRLAKVGNAFGLGNKTGIGTNPEAKGRMPTRSWYARRYKGAFRGGFTLLSAIGQGAATVTVLQLGLAYAALANGGTLYQPQVVRSIETSDGTVVQEFPPRVKRVLQIDPGHLSMIRSGLTGVVAERDGTAHAETVAGADMAGKTGTAQVSHVTPRGVDPAKVWYFNRDHAWFAGYAPASAPEI